MKTLLIRFAAYFVKPIIKYIEQQEFNENFYINESGLQLKNDSKISLYCNSKKDEQ